MKKRTFLQGNRVFPPSKVCSQHSNFIDLLFQRNEFSIILTYLPFPSYHLPGDSSSSEESSDEEEVKPKPPPAKKKKDTESQDQKKAGTSDTELKVR